MTSAAVTPELRARRLHLAAMQYLATRALSALEVFLHMENLERSCSDESQRPGNFNAWALLWESSPRLQLEYPDSQAFIQFMKTNLNPAPKAPGATP